MREGENERSLQPTMKADQLLSLLYLRIWGEKIGNVERRWNIEIFDKDFEMEEIRDFTGKNTFHLNFAI